jgi:hypothetical protein
MDMRLHDRHIAKDPRFRRRARHGQELRGSLRSLSYSLVQDSSKLRRSGCSDHWLLQVPSVITRQLMHLDSTFGHPVPPKNWIFLKQVAWRLVFRPEKVDLS